MDVLRVPAPVKKWKRIIAIQKEAQARAEVKKLSPNGCDAIPEWKNVLNDEHMKTKKKLLRDLYPSNMHNAQGRGGLINPSLRPKNPSKIFSSTNGYKVPTAQALVVPFQMYPIMTKHHSSDYMGTTRLSILVEIINTVYQEIKTSSAIFISNPFKFFSPN